MYLRLLKHKIFQSVPEDPTLLAIVRHVRVFGKVRKVAFELSALCFSDLIEAAGILVGRCLFARPHGAISYSNGRKKPKYAVAQVVSLHPHRGNFRLPFHYQTYGGSALYYINYLTLIVYHLSNRQRL
jgi:hypothetical protein